MIEPPPPIELTFREEVILLTHENAWAHRYVVDREHEFVLVQQGDRLFRLFNNHWLLDIMEEHGHNLFTQFSPNEDIREAFASVIHDQEEDILQGCEQLLKGMQ